jgi:hypothetical protein
VLKLVKQTPPPPPIKDSYRPTVGVREILIQEGAQLTIPRPVPVPA